MTNLKEARIVDRSYASCRWEHSVDARTYVGLANVRLVNIARSEVYKDRVKRLDSRKGDPVVECCCKLIDFELSLVRV